MSNLVNGLFESYLIDLIFLNISLTLSFIFSISSPGTLILYPLSSLSSIFDYTFLVCSNKELAETRGMTIGFELNSVGCILSSLSL